MKFLDVDEHGNIKSFSEPVEGFEYSLPDGYVLHVGDVDLELQYYDFEVGGLLSRTARPTSYYLWQNKTWVFDSTSFTNDVRMERNRKLAESDWTQVNDSPLSEEDKADWAAYRQLLRDLPNTLTGSERSLEDVHWPERPSYSLS